jgi:hypothetical protein
VPTYSSAADAMERLATFLGDHDEQRWSEQVAEDARLLRAGDPDGLIRFLSKFGGMGSLNDLVFRPQAADDLYGELREDAWLKAKEARGPRLVE